MESRLSNRNLFTTAEIVADLNSVWMPFPMQADIIFDLLHNDTSVFAECGRSFGKTALAIYCLYRSALLRPGSVNLLFAPQQGQARELYWNETSYLQGWLPTEGPRGNLFAKYVEKIDQQQMLIRFKNGSYIKCDGMMEFDTKRGKKFDLAVSDEFKDSPAGFWTAFSPNLTKPRKDALYKPTFLGMGTIPETEDHHFFRVKEYFKCPVETVTDEEFLEEFGEDYVENEIDKYIPKFKVYSAPSSVNPHISKRQLLIEKKKAERLGELDKYYREYECKLVKNPRTSIFPMLDKKLHIVSYDDVVAEIKKDYDNWYFCCAFDPGTASVFGTLLAAVNIWDKRVIFLDENYIEGQDQNFTRKVWETAETKCKEVAPWKIWLKIYDYAATWFANEVMNEMEDSVFKCEKDLKNKEARLSFIKMLLLDGKFVMTERCKKLFWEMDNLKKDQNGNIPKENDHLIDCARYILNAFGYTSIEQPLTPKNVPMTYFEWLEQKRGQYGYDDLPTNDFDDDYGVCNDSFAI